MMLCITKQNKVNVLFHHYLCDFSGPSGRPLHLLWKSVSVSGGEQEVEESLHICAKQLRHQSL